MGCGLSKKPSPSPSINVTSCDLKSTNLTKPIKPLIEPIEETTKPKSEKVLNQEDEVSRRSHEEERAKKTDSDKYSSSPVAEKPNSTPVVRISSCTKEEVDAILIQCGKLSRNNSAAKTRRYSGSKRSFDFDQNDKIVAEEDRSRHRGVERVNGSPRERRRRTPSREREDSKIYRSGSRERSNGIGGGGGSRRVSRSPAKRSEVPNSSSSLSRPGKFVTIPATEPSIKRITVKRNIGDACRIAAASPRSKSPARATGSNAVPSLSRSNSRKAEQSPYRRNPLGEIDQNSSKIGSCNNIKKMNESVKTNSRAVRAPSPSRAAVVEPAKPPQVVLSRSRSLRKSRDFDMLSNEDNNYTAPSPSRAAVVEPAKPPQVVLSRSRSLRKSRDFDMVSNEDNNYTALLLKDIQNFRVDDNSISLPLCVTKACSIVEAVEDLNSKTNNTCMSSDSSQFRFTSTAKKADLMEPSFEKYVTVKRGGSLEESSGSNNVT